MLIDLTTAGLSNVLFKQNLTKNVAVCISTFYCLLISSHLHQVMDCLDASLISSIDQSIENTKPSSKADMKKCRPESQQSWDLINLVGRAHLLTQLKLRSLKQSEKMFIANIRLNVEHNTNNVSGEGRERELSTHFR